MIYPDLDRLARRQHGLLTIGQLVGLGLTDLQVRRMTMTGRLGRSPARRLPGLRRPADLALGRPGGGAGCRPGAVRRTGALVCSGGCSIGHDADSLELIVPGQRTAHRGSGPPSTAWVPARSARRDGIPVTTAERTLFDLAASESVEALGRLCDEGLRRRIVTLGRLYAVVEAHRGAGRRRLAPIRSVLADRIDGYDPGANDWEQRMDRLWDRLGLPPATRQYRIQVGRRTFRVDRAIVDLRIAVEWAGFDPHGQRGHLDRDSDRRALLTAAGWCCLDFTSRSSPELICRTVSAAAAQRGRMLGLAAAAIG